MSAKSAGADSVASSAGAEHRALLEVRGLKVVFDGFHAIDGVDLTVAANEVRFLIGPNGAGKTTLVDAITGLVKPAAGSIRFEGGELVKRREHQIVRAGIGRTFQTPTVFEQLTVLENVDVAASFRLGLPSCCAAGAAAPRRSRRRWRRSGSTRSRTRKPERSRTASASGWRSRWCCARGRGCCCSTSRSPA